MRYTQHHQNNKNTRFIDMTKNDPNWRREMEEKIDHLERQINLLLKTEGEA